MYIIPPKYRGSAQYEQTKKVLVEAARNDICISYKIIWDILGLKPGNNAVKESGYILGEISEDMAKEGKPMLSVIVINQRKKTPGDGFYTLASELGKLKTNPTDEQEIEFFENEKDNVFQYDW